jgi:hypothetical protein
MSEALLWERLYEDVNTELRATRRRLLDEVHQERLRVIQLEGQRLSLLSALESAANLLKDTYPGMHTHWLGVVRQLRGSYEAAPSKVAVLPTCEAVSLEGAVPRYPGDVRSAPVHTEAGPAQSAPF